MTVVDVVEVVLVGMLRQSECGTFGERPLTDSRGSKEIRWRRKGSQR